MNPVWITGAAGLIGSQLIRLAPLPWQPRAVTRADLELTNADAVRASGFYRHFLTEANLLPLTPTLRIDSK